MASQDFVQRAATQQRAQEMQAKKLQAETYKHCLTERGYHEFSLTPEQRAKLATFKAAPTSTTSISTRSAPMRLSSPSRARSS